MLRKLYIPFILSGASAITISLLMYCFLTKSTPLYYLGIGLFFNGIANGIANTTLNTIMTFRVSNRMFATFQGAQSTLLQIASTTGMAVMLAIVEENGGSEELQGYNQSFMVGTGVALVALSLAVVLSLHIKRNYKETDNLHA